MIQVNVYPPDGKHEYHLQLQCLPRVGEEFRLWQDDNDDDFNFYKVSAVQHYHCKESGHEIHIELIHALDKPATAD